LRDILRRVAIIQDDPRFRVARFLDADVAIRVSEIEMANEQPHGLQQGSARQHGVPEYAMGAQAQPQSVLQSQPAILMSRKPASHTASAWISESACTKSGHVPVDWLHSIENAQLTNSFFPLTKKIQGVKHNCSLTVSEVFPVGAASGGQARSPSAEGRSKK